MVVSGMSNERDCLHAGQSKRISIYRSPAGVAPRTGLARPTPEIGQRGSLPSPQEAISVCSSCVPRNRGADGPGSDGSVRQARGSDGAAEGTEWEVPSRAGGPVRDRPAADHAIRGDVA